VCSGCARKAAAAGRVDFVTVLVLQKVTAERSITCQTHSVAFNYKHPARLATGEKNRDSSDMAGDDGKWQMSRNEASFSPIKRKQ